MTPAGIEPATFRLVAQHLNHCATAVPFLNYKYDKLNEEYKIPLFIYYYIVIKQRFIIIYKDQDL